MKLLTNLAVTALDPVRLHLFVQVLHAGFGFFCVGLAALFAAVTTTLLVFSAAKILLSSASISLLVIAPLLGLNECFLSTFTVFSPQLLK